MFQVQRRMCATCIYRPDSPLNVEHLESEVRDKYIGFAGFRECHHAKRGSGYAAAAFGIAIATSSRPGKSRSASGSSLSSTWIR